MHLSSNNTLLPGYFLVLIVLSMSIIAKCIPIFPFSSIFSPIFFLNVTDSGSFLFPILPSHVEISLVAHCAGFGIEMIYCLKYDTACCYNNTNRLSSWIYNILYVCLWGFACFLCRVITYTLPRPLQLYAGYSLFRVAFYAGCLFLLRSYFFSLLSILRIIATHSRLLFYAGYSPYAKFYCPTYHHIVHVLIFLLQFHTGFFFSWPSIYIDVSIIL